MSYGRRMGDAADPRGVVTAGVVVAMGELFRALATPVRLSIVMELGPAPRSVGELVEATGASQPLVSQHPRVLRPARLVAVDRRNRERVYRLLEGLNRWPSRHWAINVAWTQTVGLAANLLACFRHLALPAGE